MSRREPGIGTAVLGVLGGVLLLALLTVGAWGVKVATSGIRGEGDAVIQRNSAENWTTAQARFEGLYAEIIATDQKVQIAKEALDANPDDRTATDNYYGTRTVCLSIVADYNAEARSFLAANFRAADLPDQIDSRNPATDCQE